MGGAGILDVLSWLAGQGEGCSGALLAGRVSIFFELLATGEGGSLPLCGVDDYVRIGWG